MSTFKKEEKIKEIKTFINESKKIDKFTKSVCIELIDLSNFFTEPVCFVLDLSPVIDNRLLGTNPIEKELKEIMKPLTDFRFSYEEIIGKGVSIFCLAQVPFDPNSKRISDKFLKNKKLT